MYTDLTKYIQRALREEKNIPAARKEDLAELAAFMRAELAAGRPIHLVFICTHNSRRSQFGQAWAAAAAAWFGLENIHTYSGGTEATAFNIRAVEALVQAGFNIHDFGGENPRYRLTYSEDGPAMVCYSKHFNHPSNPESKFIAVMVCSDADQACPFLPGAIFRAPLPYIDPKIADGRASEAAEYNKRSLQIATEMLYLMKLVKGLS